MFEAAVMASVVDIIKPHLFLSANTRPSLSLSLSPNKKPTTNTTRRTRTWKNSPVTASSSSWTQNQTVGGLLLPTPHKHENHRNTHTDNNNNNNNNNNKRTARKKRVFLLDVNPICYRGSTPSLHSFAHWISLFLSQVSLGDPLIAVFDGERGNEYRRQLLPSYKAQRRKFSRQHSSRSSNGGSYELIVDVFRKLNVPVIKIEGHEADDVVATLVSQVSQKGYRVVIASPDKDFKQLISEDVQIVMPMPEFDRWSFYTLKHYVAQYNCDPCSDLSLRCIMGDDVDGVPGIQHVVPGFGRKTALKLLKKHGSLENLLNAAAVRTVARQYAQDALTKYADFLRRNYEILALRRDVDVHLQDEWLSERDNGNDLVILSNFLKLLEETQRPHHRNRSHSSNC